jgi:hypothetical protein
MGGKLLEKPKAELRAFSNSFLRCLTEHIPHNQDLKNFLFNVIEEFPDDPYITPNSVEWDV